MAVRFINPIETPYESQFVPMPLDFMYKNLQEKQAGLDAARDLTNKATFKVEASPWHEQQGLAQKKRDYFSQKTQELAAQLERDKSNYGQVVSQLADLNREYLNDPEMVELLRHATAYKTNIQPLEGKEGSQTAYYRGLKEFDPITGEYKWRQNINYEDIKAPIFNDTQNYVNENFVKFLTASAKEEDAEFRVDPSGGIVMVKKGKVTDLNTSAKYIQEAIKKYARVLLEDTHAQASYIKEYLGINTQEDLERYVEQLASKRFYNITEADVSTPISPKTSDNNSGYSPSGVRSNISVVEEGAVINPFDILAQTTTQITENITKAEERTTENFLGLVRTSSPLLKEQLVKFDAEFDEIARKALERANIPLQNKPQILALLQSNSSLFDLLTSQGSQGLNEQNPVLNSIFTPEQITDIRDKVYAGLLDLSPSATQNDDEYNAFTQFVSSVNQLREAEEVKENTEIIYNEAVSSSAEQLKVPEEEIQNSLVLMSYVEQYFPEKSRYSTSYTIDEINSNFGLKKLYDLKIITPVENFPEKRFGIEKYNPTAKDPKINTEFNKIREHTSIIRETFNQKYAQNRMTVYAADPANEKEKGAMYSIQKRYEDLVVSNSPAIAAMAQKTAASRGIGGKSYLNNTNLANILSSDDNPFKESEFDASDGYKVTGVFFDVNNLGSPTMLIRVANKGSDGAIKPNSYSGLEVDLSEADSEDKINLISDMLSSNNPAVNQVGYSWLATENFSRNMLSIPSLYFQGNSRPVNPVEFKDKEGNVYALRTSPTTGVTSISLVKPDGSYRGLDEITLSNGQRINPSNVKSYGEVMTYIGGYLSTNPFSTQSPGGASMGKPKQGDRR